MAETTEPLAEKPKTFDTVGDLPAIPKLDAVSAKLTGAGGDAFKRALGVYQPFTTAKEEYVKLLGKAESDISQSEQEQKRIQATGTSAAAQKQVADIEKSQRDLDEAMQKEPLPKFVPSKENAEDLAILFSIVNVMGFLIGGAGKENAQAAMSAMNGMLEGHQKGRADLYKKELAEFDKNFKSMVQKHAEFRKKYEDAVKLAAVDKEAGIAQAELVAIEYGSNVVKAKAKKGDILGGLETINSGQKLVEEAYKYLEKTEAEQSRRQFELEQEKERRKFELARQAAQFAHTERMKREEGATFNYFTTPDGNLVAVNTKNPKDIRTIPIDLRDATKLGAKPTALKKDESMANFVASAIGRPVDTSSAAILVGAVDFSNKLDKLKKASTELGNVTGLSVNIADRMNSFLRSNVPVDPQTGQQIITQEVLDQAWENAKTSKDYTSLSEKSKVLAKTELDTVMSYLQAKYGNRAPVAEFKAAQQAISRKNMDATAYQQVLNNEQQSAFDRLAGRGFTAADYQKVKKKAEFEASKFNQAMSGEESKKVSAAELRAYAAEHYKNDPQAIDKARKFLTSQGYEVE